MKIVRVLSIDFIRNHVEALYRTLPRKASYAEVISLFRKKEVIPPNHFPDAMQKLGYEVCDFIIDFAPCLVKSSRTPDPIEALFTFTKQVRPEIIYFERAAIASVPADVKQQLKSLPYVQRLAGYWGACLPRQIPKTLFAHLDIVFSIDAHLTKIIAAHVPRAQEIGAAFDGIPHPPTPFERRTTEVGFFGSSGYGFEDHKERFFFLQKLYQLQPFTMYCSESKRQHLLEWKYALCRQVAKFPVSVLKVGMTLPGIQKIAKKGALLKKGDFPFPFYVKHRPFSQTFPHQVFPGVFGQAYVKQLENTKIVINAHIDDPYVFGNMRCYEATGHGALLLCDRPERLNTLFRLDEEAVGYHSAEEAKEKISYLCAHPQQAAVIAQRGFERTKKEYTIYHRAHIIDHTFREEIRKK